MKYDPKKFLIYDIECFAHDLIFVFMDTEGRTAGIYHNNFSTLMSTIKNKILVGFNSSNYDDYLISLVMKEIRDGSPVSQIVTDAKELNDKIIYGKDEDRRYLPREWGLKSFDIGKEHFRDQKSPSKLKKSLKELESGLNMDIEETSVPFDIDRPLTKEEVERTIGYCVHDVEATRRLFKVYENDLVIKYNLMERAGVQEGKGLMMSNQKLTEKIILKGSRPEISSRLKLTPDWKTGGDERIYSLVPEEVAAFWKSARLKDGRLTCQNGETKVECDLYGLTFTYGQGGIHGDPILEHGKYENVVVLDVDSMYPSIMKIQNTFGDNTADFVSMIDERLVLKRQTKQADLDGNRELHKHLNETQATLKIVLNSAYGILKNKYFDAFDPYKSLSICAYGQATLTDLCRRLYEAGAKLINANTDGIIFTGISESVYMPIKEAWEKEFSLSLSVDLFDKMIQKDVSSYIAVKPGGKVKAKGGDLNLFEDMKDYSDSDAIRDLKAGNTARIVHIAAAEYMLYDKPIIDSIYEYMGHPELFFFTAKSGTAFEIKDQNGNVYQRVNRLFAVKPSSKKSLNLSMIKRENGRSYKLLDAPDSSMIFNGDLEDVPSLVQDLDVNYYYKLIKKAADAYKLSGIFPA